MYIINDSSQLIYSELQLINSYYAVIVWVIEGMA